MIEMRLETSLNDLEELILKNKNDVKSINGEVQRIEKVLKDPVLTAPVKILDDDIRFFSSLFKRKKDARPKYRQRELMTSHRMKQREDSLVKYRTERSRSKESDPSLPRFTERSKRGRRGSRSGSRFNAGRSRESYFNELELEVMRKMKMRQTRKLPDLRPEQYKEKCKGLIPSNQIILDSMDNLRFEKNLTKSTKERKRRPRGSKSPSKNRKYQTERKSKLKSKLKEHFQTSVNLDRYGNNGTVSKRLMIERRLRERVARSRKGRSPRFKSIGRKSRRASGSRKKKNGSMMIRRRM